MTLEPGDQKHVDAAEGWIGLGNWNEANEALERVSPLKKGPAGSNKKPAGLKNADQGRCRQCKSARPFLSGLQRLIAA
jgi:hypothetical protein